MAENEQGSGSNRGFGGMDPNKQRDATKKGNPNIPAEKQNVSQNPGMASQVGKKNETTPDGKKNTQEHNVATDAGRKGQP